RGAAGGGRGRGAVPAETTVTLNPAPPRLDPARGGIFRSDNRGRSFTLITNCNARPMYFSQLRVDPTNPNTIYVAGLPVAKSLDGGKTESAYGSGGSTRSWLKYIGQLRVDPTNPNTI